VRLIGYLKRNNIMQCVPQQTVVIHTA